MVRKQATHRVLMVRPAHFGFNPETAANNYFQNLQAVSSDTAAKALQEFDNYVALLRAHGVEVTVVQDTSSPYTPDSIFPNNWFSTHITGELVLYPMFAPNRRQERKPEALTVVRSLKGITKVIDLTPQEQHDHFLEGTGSMCLDRVNRIVYCCASERSHQEPLKQFCKDLDYQSICFEAKDAATQPIYHTNVMMCVATHFAVICLESIVGEASRNKVVKQLQDTGHEVVDISLEQVNHFAGNMLEVLDSIGHSLLLMSASAKQSLTPHQVATLERYSHILAPDITTIETIGGGSARCMVAELFL